LKNLQGAALNAAVDEALQSVNLAEQATRQKLSGEYSGGMKRRLSVAISLIGNPLVVYLDEPSTGLDPASRHQLWEAILKAKKNRTIILTTHSMEEAEVLCDKIGIFVAGELRCYGAPQQLTHRYGSNYSLTATVNPGMVPKAKEFLSSLAPGAYASAAILPSHPSAALDLRAHCAVLGAVASALVGDTLRCSIPISSITPEQIFSKMEAARQTVGVRDWGVANASLEDVFIQVTPSALCRTGFGEIDSCADCHPAPD
jgi:ABC-type multidrug transport system ATPase subunit